MLRGLCLGGGLSLLMFLESSIELLYMNEYMNKLQGGINSGARYCYG